MKQVVFLNVYRSGVYHRQGKPDTTNLHAGDVYVTEQAALENAEPDRGYLMTISATIEVPDGAVLYVNPHNSLPTPLSVTQRNAVMLPWLDWPGNAIRDEEVHAPAIETSERETAVGYEEFLEQSPYARHEFWPNNYAAGAPERR